MWRSLSSVTLLIQWQCVPALGNIDSACCNGAVLFHDPDLSARDGFPDSDGCPVRNVDRTCEAPRQDQRGNKKWGYSLYKLHLNPQCLSTLDLRRSVSSSVPSASRTLILSRCSFTLGRSIGRRTLKNASKRVVTHFMLLEPSERCCQRPQARHGQSECPPL